MELFLEVVSDCFERGFRPLNLHSVCINLSYNTNTVEKYSCKIIKKIVLVASFNLRGQSDSYLD